MSLETNISLVKNARGGFFAVDRRAWHLVCGLGMNAAVAYLVLARGTGGDNRTTKWSTNAVEARTGISRSRAQEAIRSLERAGALHRDPASKPGYPKYKVTPAHEIGGCEGAPPEPLAGERARVHVVIAGEWTDVPKSISGRQANEYSRWGSWCPQQVAKHLVQTGHAELHQNGRQFRGVSYNAEAAARADWIWLPNALVDGAAEETPPVELIRQTGNGLALRLFVNLYGSQNLAEDGGIHFRRIRQVYARHKIGQQGAFVVWGFAPKTTEAWSTSQFAAPHFSPAKDADAKRAAWAEFWECWNLILEIGLVELVGHLVHVDTDEGEIIHPVALPGTGLEIERLLGQAAIRAASALITQRQIEWAAGEGIVMLAPVRRHIEGVQMLGIARLRYHPRTTRTLAFMAREDDWRTALERLEEVGAGSLATSRGHQG